MLPWVVAAAAGVVVVVLAVAYYPRAPDTSLRSPPPSLEPRVPLTPREQADNFFDQAVRAFENGDTATAAFYRPLALEAYAQLGSVDPDTRFHIGLLDLTASNLEGALAQADSIALGAPNHLFVQVLRQRVYRRRGDAERLQQIYQAYLERYQAEIATNRVEYQSHGRMLEALAQEARGGG
jgi:tetratricopeptide (TPR) repeat protein